MQTARYLDAEASEVVRRGVPIERQAGRSGEAFAEAHIRHGGRPVIVTDLVSRWPAAAGWSFERFERDFGADPVVANCPFFLDELPGLKPVQLQTTLRDYVAYVRDPQVEPRGHWARGSWPDLQANGIPLYAPGYRVFVHHPELEQELDPSPYFADDLLRLLPPHLRRLLDRLQSPVHYLFFAPRGAVAFLHADYWDTHAYLAQLAGRKLCILFGPDDEEVLAGLKDPLQEAEHPGLARATPWVGELRAGDTLFVPSRWQHFVVTLEPSLTFSYDFFTRENMGVYLSSFFTALARFLSADQDPLVLAQARALFRSATLEAEAAGTRQGSSGPARS
jgi:hypothetical protein